MRIKKDDAEKNRERIVDAASKILREQGIAAVGVDGLAKAAGLTHGAVYSHFKSKDKLVVAAMARAIETSSEEWKTRTSGEADALSRIIRSYISRSHRDNPGTGCSVTSLGVEASRGDKAMRETAARAVTSLLASIEGAAEGRPDGREFAITTLAAMVGAVVLARAAQADGALSDEILKLVRRDLLARHAKG